MHVFTAAIALFASLALSQATLNNAINIPAGQSTLAIVAGQAETITWTNPSSGAVTIKLQQAGSSITPESGITLVTGLPASSGTYTFTIDPTKVNSFQYTIEIIDETNTKNINFSPNFGIPNAQGTAVGTASGSASATTGSASATATTGSSSITSSAASSGTSASSSGSSASSASRASQSSSSARSSSSSAASSQSTSAPSSNNGRTDLKVQGGLVAVVAVAVAIL